MDVRIDVADGHIVALVTSAAKSFDFYRLDSLNYLLHRRTEVAETGSDTYSLTF